MTICKTLHRYNRYIRVILAVGFLGMTTACQIKGMYATKTGQVLPLNASFMKKSELDRQAVAVDGPQGYKYYAETVKGDETVIPQKAISAWQWTQIAKTLSDAFSGWDKNNAAVEIAKDSNATKVASEQIAADVTKSTFVPPTQ
jgi:hypothetical protein